MEKYTWKRWLWNMEWSEKCDMCFCVFKSVLRSKTRRNKMYKAPVAWIMASNTLSNLGTKTIKKLHEELRQSNNNGRILNRKMDIIVQPDSILNSGLVDTCKTCSELYLSSAAIDCPNIDIITVNGDKLDFQTYLLNLTVLDTDKQQLIMNVDSQICSTEGIVLTCHSSME